MSDNKKEITRYHLENKMLIGYRDDHTMFWLKTDKDYREPDKDELNVLAAGKAWIDKKSDTTILDFPTSDEAEIHNLEKEFLQSPDSIKPYAESDFYVLLDDCLPNKPILDNNQLSDCLDHIDHYYDLPENTEGFILNEDTFIRKDNEIGKLYFIKFSEFSNKDLENDRFGWIKAARKYLCFPSDEDLIPGLGFFRKESYGDAWIDEENDLLVLGPVEHQDVVALGTCYDTRVCSYLRIYSKWDQTPCWIDIESGMKSTPFDYKAYHFYILDKYTLVA
jgi:hypothetical protein